MYQMYQHVECFDATNFKLQNVPIHSHRSSLSLTLSPVINSWCKNSHTQDHNDDLRNVSRAALSPPCGKQNLFKTSVKAARLEINFLNIYSFHSERFHDSLNSIAFNNFTASQAWLYKKSSKSHSSARVPRDDCDFFFCLPSSSTSLSPHIHKVANQRRRRKKKSTELARARCCKVISSPWHSTISGKWWRKQQTATHLSHHC